MLRFQLENVPCPLGCSKKDEIVLVGRDLLHGLPGEFTVVKCRTCGLMRTNPRPTPETIAFYYPDDYGPYVGTRVQQTDAKRTSLMKTMLRPVVKRLFNFNTNTLPPLPPGRMLEVGCASGAFLHHMSAQGWQVEGSSSHPRRHNRHCSSAIPFMPAHSKPRLNPIDLLISSSAGWCWSICTTPSAVSEIVQMDQARRMAGADSSNSASLEFRVFKRSYTHCTCLIIFTISLLIPSARSASRRLDAGQGMPSAGVE